MTAQQSIVVIGAGLAGAKTVGSLRARGHTGPLTLIGRESHLPYERPPLSKEYLSGEGSFEDALVHPEQWYLDRQIDLRLGTSATAIDTAARTITLEDGSTLPYDSLVLATGSSPRRSELPGADAAGVLYLRSREDADAIRPLAATGTRIVVIGGGWIGLEVAAVTRAGGAEVTVLERGHLPLARILGDKIAQVYADLHLDHGVQLLTDTEAAEILVQDGRATGVRLVDGRTLEADAVVVGIGAVPHLELAEAAGLTLEQGGVAVDASLRSSDPDVYAVGDIAAHQHPLLGRRVRVEHWATALNQPKAVARTILGTITEYTELPYFYTDQYDLGMEYLGSAPQDQVADVVVRGDLDSREFIAFWRDRDEALLAVMAVNIWDVIDQVKPVLTEGRPVDAARLSDPAVALSDL
ncbi:NAD(P)/FAD-dependent oxidoreductase [Brachybacterium sp. FME24]|uniref:NAD(P)/FAD-dependent oxidoreductase n=1 Tax=Brachybacterium sp. FME24 TaxID=2742605 RepID=UPI0018669727|nr:FAD-dependent oxidoreductase [Brachybacterium sp. FME24]